MWFKDKYGTEVIVRRQQGSEHVQLLMRFADGSEPFSYGFTPVDFERFANQVIELSTLLKAQQ